MKLRRFTSAGVEMARQYLAAVKESNDVENVTLNGQPFTRAALISSPAYSDAIPALADIDLDETRTFDTTFAFCEYFDSLIHDHNPQAYREDVGFWTWLAMVYLPQLVTESKNGLSVGDMTRLVYHPENYQRQYRHLLAGAFYVYVLYSQTSGTCHFIFAHKFNVFPDVAEQIMSKQSIVQNPAFMRAANALYYDAEEFRARKGSGGEGPGAARYFVQTIDQLSMTRDFFEAGDADVLLRLLPKQFDRFNPVKKVQIG